METIVETIAFTDRPISTRQLIAELKGLALPDNAFAGIRRSNRTILDDGSIRREDHHTIEIKLRAAVSAADKRRIAAVVESHVPSVVSPTI